MRRQKDYVAEVEDRTERLVDEWVNEMDERDTSLPRGHRQPKPAELLSAVLLKYPPQWMDVPEVGPMFESPFILLLVLDDRVKGRKKLLKQIEEARKAEASTEPAQERAGATERGEDLSVETPADDPDIEEVQA